jgi:hypothetical protein
VNGTPVRVRSGLDSRRINQAFFDRLNAILLDRRIRESEGVA